MMNTDKAWERWGRTDPYYGVLSVPQFRGARRDTATGFFESGSEFIDSRLSAARSAYGDIRMGRALDFGCGVGRLLIPLSQNFGEAIGLDISQAMRSECLRNLHDRGVENAEVLASDDGLTAALGVFDFVNSFIVLQHIPVDRGYEIIARLLSLVAPGGVISLQFTVDRSDRAHQAALYWAQRRIPGVQIITNLLKRRPLAEPLVEMNEYNLPRVLALFQEYGMTPPIIEHGFEGRVRSATLMAQRAH